MGYPKIHLLYEAGLPRRLFVVKSPKTYDYWEWGFQEPDTREIPTGANSRVSIETREFGIAYLTTFSQSDDPARRVFQEDVDQDKLEKLIDQMKNEKTLKDEIF